MKRFVLSMIVEMALAAVLYGQGLKLPEIVKGDPGKFVKVSADTTGKIVQWYSLDEGLDIFPAELLKDTKTAVVTAPTRGRYRLLAYTAISGNPTPPAVCTVVIGDAPVPPGPVPPGPTPPGPGPSPAPIPREGLHVLIVYETADASKLPPAQQAILYGETVRTYLNSKCAADPGVGAWKAWRIYDKDVDLSGESKLWRDAMLRPRQTVPWVIVSNGRQGYEGPLPANVDDMLALLKTFEPPARKKVKRPLQGPIHYARR